MDTPAKRLRWAREHANYTSASAAADAKGWNGSTYRTHENGQRNFRVPDAKIYSKAFGVPWLWLMEGGKLTPDKSPRSALDTAVPVTGEVAAGQWLDIDASLGPDDFPQHPIAASLAYPHSAQYGLIVRGTSIDRVAAPGSILHCVNMVVAGLEPKLNQLVVVERRRAQQGQREVTAKRISWRGAITVLSPDSTDTRWRPVEFDGDNQGDEEQVEVIALVIGIYIPLIK